MSEEVKFILQDRIEKIIQSSKNILIAEKRSGNPFVPYVPDGYIEQIVGNIWKDIGRNGNLSAFDLPDDVLTQKFTDQLMDQMPSSFSTSNSTRNFSPISSPGNVSLAVDVHHSSNRLINSSKSESTAMSDANMTSDIITDRSNMFIEWKPKYQPPLKAVSKEEIEVISEHTDVHRAVQKLALKQKRKTKKWSLRSFIKYILPCNKPESHQEGLK